MLLGLYLFLVIALPLALGGLVAFKGLPRGRICPGCTAETFRLRSRPHRLASRVLRQEVLQLRWCPACEWTGAARLPRPMTTPAPAPAAAPSRAARTSGGSPGLEIRRTRIDGDPWRVRLQCWAEDGTWRGRLFFVSPTGRFWVDDRPCLTGESALQVLSQALSMPDQALAGRIRKVTR